MGKKGKEPAEPTALKINLRLHHVGEGGPEPVAFELNPKISFSNAKYQIDAIVAQSALGLPHGALCFAQWDLKHFAPPHTQPNRRVRDASPLTVYSYSWIYTMGVKEESCIVLHKTDSGYRVVWLMDVPDVPSYRAPAPPKVEDEGGKKGKKK